MKRRIARKGEIVAFGIWCATAACEPSRCSEPGPDSMPNSTNTNESSSASDVGTSEETSTSSDEFPLSSFNISISYGPCEERLNGCSETFGLLADGTFYVHSDSFQYPIKDQVSVKLPPDEFDRLRKAAFVPELQERLNNPRACADEIVDFRATLMLQYRCITALLQRRHLLLLEGLPRQPARIPTGFPLTYAYLFTPSPS